MINIFIPIVENVEGFCEFIAKHKEQDKHIYVGIRESLKAQFSTTNDNVEIHVFADKSNKEEIINGLAKCERVKGKLLLLRRPLTDSEYKDLVTSDSEITTLRAHHNRFVTWLKNFARRVIKRFFAFSFFEDISAICYDEFLHEFVSSCTNLSMATRINKYVGVEVEENITPTAPVKKDYNRAKNAGILAVALLTLSASIAGAGCIFAFVKPLRALFVVLVIAMLFVSLTVFSILLIHFTRTLAVGNLEYNAAEEVEMFKANISFTEEVKELVDEKPKKVSKTPKKASESPKTKKQTTKTVKDEKTKDASQTHKKVSQAPSRTPKTNKTTSIQKKASRTQIRSEK